MELEIRQRIETALDSIRDYLRNDGGDVRIYALTPENVLQVELIGNCEACSMRFMTLKAGIEEVVKRHVPEIQSVEAI